MNAGRVMKKLRYFINDKLDVRMGEANILNSTYGTADSDGSSKGVPWFFNRGNVGVMGIETSLELCG